MISPKMQEAFDAQINEELFSAHLYLAMSIHCEAQSFKGFGAWLRAQHQEELEHASKLIEHVLARGGKPTLKAIREPSASFGSIPKVFEAVVAHERHITAQVHKLYELALAEKDVAAQLLMQWYVNEQVEEEATATEIHEKLKMVGDRPGSALYLDKEYGKRGRKP